MAVTVGPWISKPMDVDSAAPPPTEPPMNFLFQMAVHMQMATHIQMRTNMPTQTYMRMHMSAVIYEAPANLFGASEIAADMCIRKSVCEAWMSSRA